MTTGRDLVACLAASLRAGTRAAVAIVIETDGSVYRRAGACSVVAEDGRILGIISGGCVEQDLFDHAKTAWETGEARRMTYDFRSPDDLLWGMGAGCNGALEVCLLPFDTVSQRDLAVRLLEAMERRATSSVPYVSAMVIQSDHGAKVPLGPLPDDEATLLAELLEGVSTKLVSTAVQGVACDVFLEHVEPRPRLVVLGAGEDARPLVQFAAQADWYVTVVDHRDAFANTERFPLANEAKVIRRADYATLSLHPNSYAVVMTHNYELDQQILGNLLKQSLPYVGVLGPRRRVERLLDDMMNAGLTFDHRALAAIHSPIGLDIGAETPEEIALSILSELMARAKERTGVSLREKAGQLTGSRVTTE